MWIINITILYLLMQSCLSTKLIDLPDTEEYDDGVKSFNDRGGHDSYSQSPAESKSRIFQEVERPNPDYQLQQSSRVKTGVSTELQNPHFPSDQISEITRPSPKYPLKQSSREKTGDSTELQNPNLAPDQISEITRPSPKYPIKQSSKEKTGDSTELQNPHIPPDQSITDKVRPDFKGNKHHSRRHYPLSQYSEELSNRNSKETERRSIYYPVDQPKERIIKHRQSSRESTSHRRRKIKRRANRPAEETDKYDNEKDENIKTKLASLVEQTLHDTEKKIESVQHIKSSNRDTAPYKIGFILSMVKKSRDMLNELFNTAVKHRDSWRALEQLKIFELIAHTNVDTTNLVRQLVEIHIHNLNTSSAHHAGPSTSGGPPASDRKRVVLL